MEEYKIPYKFVVLTCEECDVTERIEGAMAEYLEDNGLTEQVAAYAAEWLRDYYDDNTDPYYEAIEYAIEFVLGKAKADELREMGE